GGTAAGIRQPDLEYGDRDREPVAGLRRRARLARFSHRHPQARIFLERAHRGRRDQGGLLGAPVRDPRLRGRVRPAWARRGADLLCLWQGGAPQRRSDLTIGRLAYGPRRSSGGATWLDDFLHLREPTCARRSLRCWW